MKKFLFVKFISAMIFLGILGFTTISLVGTDLVEDHVESVYSGRLYREASKITGQRAIKYYQNIDTPTEFYDSLCSSVYEKEEILLISPKGKVLMDTSQKFIAEDFPELKSFDPGKSSGSYYQIGDFFGYFQEEQLSVMVPVTVNMQVKGYVSIHLPMSVLCHQRDSLLDTIHILFLLFLGIMMLIIPIFYIMINRPLKKNHTRSKHVCIWKSQIQYSFR